MKIKNRGLDSVYAALMNSIAQRTAPILAFLLVLITGNVFAADTYQVNLTVPGKSWKVKIDLPAEYMLSDLKDRRSPAYGVAGMLLRGQSREGDVLTVQWTSLNSYKNCEAIVEKLLFEMAKMKAVDSAGIEKSLHSRYLLYRFADPQGIRRFWYSVFSRDDLCIYVTISKIKERRIDDQGSMAIINSLSIVE